MCVIEDAACMTEGYQRAMMSSQAKYKIYLHQDVMIIEENFLQHLLDIFADKEVGMIGMIGSPEMPENSIMWYGSGLVAFTAAVRITWNCIRQVR